MDNFFSNLMISVLIAAVVYFFIQGGRENKARTDLLKAIQENPNKYIKGNMQDPCECEKITQ